MGKYRKKPIIIEAFRWFENGDHPEDGSERLDDGKFKGEKSEGRVVRYFRRPDIPGDSLCSKCNLKFNIHGWIETSLGGRTVCPGDFIITGVNGEKYPRKPDVFLATYEKV